MALLSTEKFIELYKSYKGEVTDVEFAEFLNSKGYRTTQNTKFNDKSVRKRRIDNNIKSKAPLEYGATKTLKSFKDEAKELGIDTKGLTNEEIKNKVRNRRGTLVKKERILTDPEYAAKKAKASADWAKANPEKVEASQYAYNQRRYLEKGMPPPVKTPKEALWRDLFVTAQNQKVDNRLKLTKKFGKYIPLKDFLDAKITDNKTGKTITFKNLEKYINPKNTRFNYKDVITPYEQKHFINRTPGLRTEINSKLIENWNAGDKRNFFEIQHTAGRYNDPFNVHLSNKNVNLKESQVRTKFEKMWNNSKNLSQKKKAFQLYKESLPAGIASQPSMITRTREFGERLPLDEMLRETKAEGVQLPRGILKEIKELENVAITTYDNADAAGKIKLENRIGCKRGCFIKTVREEPQKLIRLFRGESFKFRSMDGMKAMATALGQPLEKVKKMNLSGQWFSPDPVLASGYADKLGKTKYVDVTPAEYEMMKRYKDKVNLTSDFSGKRRFPLSTKETYTTIPKIKLKQFADTGRLKSKLSMLGEVDVPPGVLTYDSVLGGFVDSANPDEVVGQNQLKTWAEDNPMKVEVGTELPKANKSVLKTVGRTLAHIGAPLPTALIDSYFINKQMDEGKSTAEIAKDPLNWLGLATMEPLTKMAGANAPGGLNAVLRLGLNPATIRGITRFAGLPGLAISTAMTAYDQYKKYQNEEGFVYNLFNKEGN